MKKVCNLVSFLFLQCLFLFLPLSGEAQQILEVFDIPDEPVELGQGWDSQRERPTAGRCIIFSPVQARGQLSTVIISEVSDSSELSEALNISASGTANFLAGSSTISGSFVVNSNISASNISYSLNAEVRNGVLSVGPYSRSGPVRFNFPALDEPEPRVLKWWEKIIQPNLDAEHHHVMLTEQAIDILESENGRVNFLRYCGDSYISAISSGAELSALITHREMSSEENREIKAHVEASFGMGSINADVSSEISAKLASSEFRFQFIQIGGGDGQLPIEKDDLSHKLHSLQTEAIRAPVFYDLSAASYEGLINWPKVELENPEIKDTTEKLIDLYLTISSLYRTYVDIWQNRKRNWITSVDHRLRMDSLNRCMKSLKEVIVKRQKLNAQPVPRGSYTFAGSTEVSSITNSCPGLFEGAKGSDVENFEKALRISVNNYSQKWLLEFKLALPLPPMHLTDREDFNADNIVEKYVARAARRACSRDPQDDDCMSEKSIQALKAKVPMGFLRVDSNYEIESFNKEGCWDVGFPHLRLKQCGGSDWSFNLKGGLLEGRSPSNPGNFCVYPQDGMKTGKPNADLKTCPSVKKVGRWLGDSQGRLCWGEGEGIPESCNSGMCLTYVSKRSSLAVRPCNGNDMNQRWHSMVRVEQ